MVGLYVRVPRSWLERLQFLATKDQISVASVVRMFLRAMLYPERS